MSLDSVKESQVKQLYCQSCTAADCQSAVTLEESVQLASESAQRQAELEVVNAWHN